MSPELQLSEINSAFRRLSNSGRLLTLPEFLKLPSSERDHIRRDAHDLLTRIERFERWIEDQKLRELVPMIDVPKHAMECFETEIVPARPIIVRLASELPELMCQLDELFEDVDFFEGGESSKTDYLKERMLRILSRYTDVVSTFEQTAVTLDPDGIDTDYEVIGRLEVICESKFFQPTNWLSRISAISPIVSSRPTKNFPMPIRGRMAEAFDCFVGGQFFATIVVCRSLLEFLLLDRARPYFGIEPYKQRDGKRETLTLAQLIEHVTEKQPDLKDDLELVRQTANPLVHPPKGREIDEFPPQERIALKILATTFKIVEQLYP